MQALHSREHSNNSKLFQASAKDTSTHGDRHTHTHAHAGTTYRQPQLQKRIHCGKMEMKNFPEKENFKFKKAKKKESLKRDTF